MLFGPQTPSLFYSAFVDFRNLDGLKQTVVYSVAPATCRGIFSRLFAGGTRPYLVHCPVKLLDPPHKFLNAEILAAKFFFHLLQFTFFVDATDDLIDVELEGHVAHFFIVEENDLRGIFDAVVDGGVIRDDRRN